MPTPGISTMLERGAGGGAAPFDGGAGLGIGDGTALGTGAMRADLRFSRIAITRAPYVMPTTPTNVIVSVTLADISSDG